MVPLIERLLAENCDVNVYLAPAKNTLDIDQINPHPKTNYWLIVPAVQHRDAQELGIEKTRKSSKRNRWVNDQTFSFPSEQTHTRLSVYDSLFFSNPKETH